MKIVSLSPQFVFEPPAGEKDADAENASSELGQKLARTEATTAADDGDKLDRETREGLRRLTQLVRKKRGAKKDERQRSRALELYKRLADAEDPRAGRGENVDVYV